MSEKGDSAVAHGVPSTVAFGKHPFHPAVAGFPIAFLSAGLATDLLFWRTGNAIWAEFSFWLIVAGLATGAVAFLTGLIDFLTIERARARLAGWAHFLLTDLALFLSVLNLAARLDDRNGSILFAGLGMSAAVTAALLAAGYLGGRLVYFHLIGVYGSDRTAQRLAGQQTDKPEAR